MYGAFGPDVTEAVLARNDLRLFARSHELEEVRGVGWGWRGWGMEGVDEIVRCLCGELYFGKEDIFGSVMAFFRPVIY